MWMQGGKRRKKTEKVGYTNRSSLTTLLMDTAHILQFVDEVLSAKTGKRLNDLQRKIIEGILKRQKYYYIADTYGCTAGHAKDVGYKLLQMLSNVFGEPVDKGNLESVLERQLNLKIHLVDRTTNSGNSHTINYINGCSELLTPTPDKSQPATPDYHDGANQGKIEMVGKLRELGLKDEQIAGVLGLALEAVKQVD
ncbi:MULTISPECIES: hypothetical protein [unclassified Microcoleus]|uniref:hypothetical protein n=2 Tax=unclassified Microcoleus TaxID=2642155 RepID=UPI002FD333D8